MSVDISQTICQAIDILVNKKLSSANFNQVVQGSIKKVVDANARKYYVKYSGSPSKKVAYALQGTTYKKGDIVTLLLPKNEDAIILNKKVLENSGTAISLQNYTLIGDNLVYKNNNNLLFEWGNLCSYKGNDSIVFYTNSNNEATENDKKIKNYIKSSPNGVVFSAIITTRLASTQIEGNYGVDFTCVFKNANSNTPATVQQKYRLDIRDIVGVNPYIAQTAMKVEHIVREDEFDFENFLYLKQVKLFCENFPNDTLLFIPGTDPAEYQYITNFNPIPSQYYDIIIANPSICTAYVLSSEESADYHLSFKIPKGQYLYTNGNDDGLTISQVPVIATLQKMGIDADDMEDVDGGVKYRWFVKDLSVNSNSHSEYDSYAGVGWRSICKVGKKYKNRKKFIFTIDSAHDEIPYYLVRSSQITVKCIVFFGGNHWSKEINIYYDSGYRFEMTCNKAKNVNNSFIFYKSSGTNDVRFTCNISLSNNSNDTITGDYHTYWLIQSLEKAEPTSYHNQTGYTYSPSGNNIIGSFSQGTLTCTIYKGTTFLGDITVNLFYKPGTAEYRIDLQGGNKLIQYDDSGKIAASDQGLIIQPLTFQIFKPSGQIIKKPTHANPTSQVVSWLWQVPKEKCCITPSPKVIENNNVAINPISADNLVNYNIQIEDDTSKYDYYYGEIQREVDGTWETFEDIQIGALYFTYNNYNKKNINNTIKLYVSFYKDKANKNLPPVQMQVTTTFTPVRMGDPGTNGTNTIAYIKPYKKVNGIRTSLDNVRRTYILTTEVNPPTDIDHITTYNETTNRFYADASLTPSQTTGYTQYADDGQVFLGYKFYLQRNNVVVNELEITSSNINWKIPFKTKKSKNVSYNSFFKIIGEDSISQQKIVVKSDLNFPNKTNTGFSERPNTSNILRATYNTNPNNKKSLIYYAEYPICYIRTLNLKQRIFLQPTSGFTYVVYSESGIDPRYDGNNEFVLKFYNVAGQDISNDFNFYWDVFQGEGLNIPDKDINHTNTITINPNDTFDGRSIQTAITCIIKQKNNDSIYATVFIPIYMLLNRYNHKNLNAWDGNSIEIDDTDGFILAPEIGAGRKEGTNNSFTGVLMGEIITDNDGTEKSEVGLFGYDQGIRSFFLDSQDGSARIGKEGAGQIKINVDHDNEAIIESGDYDWDTSINFSTNEPNGAGMRIKFSSTGTDNGKTNGTNNRGPFIKFGSGNFYVTHKGYLHATGANISGNITIDNIGDAATALLNNGQIADKSTVTALNNTVQSINSTIQGLNQTYLKTDNSTPNQTLRVKYVGLGKNTVTKTALSSRFGSTPYDSDSSITNVDLNIWAGQAWKSSNKLNFAVDDNGHLFAKGATIGGTIVANSKVGNSSISSNGNITVPDTTAGMGLTASSYDFSSFPGMDNTPRYLNFWAKNNSSSLSINNLYFGVTTKGELLAKSAHITGAINATSGKIGAWTIDDGRLIGENLTGSNPYRVFLDAKSSRTYAIWAGTGNTSDDRKFSVTKSGTLYATGATISGNITITNTSKVIKDLGIDEKASSAALAKEITDRTTAIQSAMDGLSTTYLSNLDKKTGDYTIGFSGLGAWEVNNADIRKNFNSTTPTGSGKTTVNFWSGTEKKKIAKMNFLVDNTGHLYAKNATVAGKIIATQGQFTGKITSKEGKIGAWTIGETNLTNGYIGLGSRKIKKSVLKNTIFPNSYTYTGSDADVEFRIWGGSSVQDADFKFGITKAGTLFAKGAYIQGAHIDSLAASKITGSVIKDGWGIDFTNGTFSIGSISANKITTGTLNASNVTISNLTVTDGMISSVNANKINASTVNGHSVKWQQMNIVTGVSYNQATSGSENGKYKIKVQNSSGNETWVSGIILTSLGVSSGNYYLLVSDNNG